MSHKVIENGTIQKLGYGFLFELLHQPHHLSCVYVRYRVSFDRLIVAWCRASDDSQRVDDTLSLASSIIGKRERQWPSIIHSVDISASGCSAGSVAICWRTYNNATSRVYGPHSSRSCMPMSRDSRETLYYEWRPVRFRNSLSYNCTTNTAADNFNPSECRRKLQCHIEHCWYTLAVDRVGCYIRYSEPAQALLAVLNVTAHPSTASVPITVLLYNGPLLCCFNVHIKG